MESPRSIEEVRVVRCLTGLLAAIALVTMAWLVRVPSPLVAGGAPPYGRLEGRVTDIVTEEPLPGVLVSAAGYAARTDANGHYLLALPEGRYHIRAEAPGYIGMTQAFVLVRAEEARPLDWEMVPEAPDERAEAKIEAKLRGLAQDVSTVQHPEDLPGAVGAAAVTQVPETIRVLMPDGAVVVMALEEYLRGVVPSEMPPTWPREALRAQAVAARSYAATRHAHLDVGADICTTTHCQVWNNRYYDTTDRAVADTRGIVGRYQGNIIYAFFFAHCDGRTRNNEEVWAGAPVPYLRSVPCSCGYTFMWGHGVGMCQEGARAMALQGYSYVDILTHYYTGIEVPPSLTFLTPQDGQRVRGVIRPAVTGSGNITYLAYYVDGALRAQGDASLVWYWNTAAETEGPHTLRAVVNGSQGQGEVSILVWVDNTPPTGAVSSAPWSITPFVTVTISGSEATAIQFSEGWAWEGESLPYWAGTAQVVADPAASGGLALAGLAGQNSPGAWYGPYTCALPPGRDYEVFYRFKTSDRTRSIGLLTIDVADAQGARRYAERPLAAQEFSASGVYEEFSLRFSYGAQAPTCATPTSGDGLEFRTWYSGAGDLYLDRIAAFSAPITLTAAMTASWPLPQEGLHPLTVRLRDVAGNSADFPLTVGVDLTPPQWLTVTPPALWVQDALSGLDPASAAWAASYDGGKTWAPWQPLTVEASVGITAPVQLEAPAPPEGSSARTHLRYRIRDVAGNWVESAPLLIPLDLPPKLWLPLITAKAGG